VSGLSTEKREQENNMARYIDFRKHSYMQLKTEARQQMALISRSRMSRRGGRGSAVGQPFYASFI